MNKITPDNYESLKKQIAETYLRAEMEDERTKFVTVFFNKACNEEKYTSIYIKLIEDIAMIEHNTCGTIEEGVKFTLKKA